MKNKLLGILSLVALLPFFAQAASAKYFYVLLPEGKEWQFDDLMLRVTNAAGVSKDTAMIPASEYCGWFYMVFDEPPENAILFLKSSPAKQIGINGLWGESEVADPVNLKMLFEAFNVDKLFFIPDDNDWPDNGVDQGWYIAYPKVEGICFFNLAAVIYDTDKSVNPLFTEDGVDLPSAGGVGSCVGVHQGMVKEDLGPDNKPQFNPNSAWARTCFIDETHFNTLFNYTSGVNEVQCYDMSFGRYGGDSRWTFISDSSRMLDNTGKLELVGGFSPLENSNDAGVVTLDGVTMGPLPAARIKRPAAGPVSILDDAFPITESGTLIQDFDHYCNSPGWSGGVDCEGLFAARDEPVTGGFWCWGSSCNSAVKRWGFGSSDELASDEKRNQQFCSESHANFTYNENQEITIRGDDDIWVFVNKKLAIDLGGAHLPAPGHVALKNLNDTYGKDFLVPGNDYPLDIFFCDRRTTMSNMTIKTAAMHIRQYPNMDVKKGEDGSDTKVCVEVVGDDCASVALGRTQYKVVPCNVDVTKDIHFVITTSKGDTVSVLTPGKVNYGGIDLTNLKEPIINPQKITGLEPGEYRLYVEVNGKSTYREFRVLDPSEVIPKFSGVPAGMGFRVQSLGSSQFSIVLPLAVNVAEPYAVMDLQGRIISRGVLRKSVTNLSVPAPGFYVVKVGSQVQRVNLR